MFELWPCPFFVGDFANKVSLSLLGIICVNVIIREYSQSGFHYTWSICATKGGKGVCNYHISLGTIEIQIQAQYFPNIIRSVLLLEIVIAIMHTWIATPSSVRDFIFRWHTSFMLLCRLRQLILYSWFHLSLLNNGEK